jgi:23S rRNA (pseudouridine1915-N3)-methyltransferase
MYDSPTLSRQFVSVFEQAGAVTMVIGGAYGVSDELQTRAQVIWSLSSLVFPHQLVRLLLTEQIYRAQEIAAGHPYHHE